ncbi:hypothetical protein ACPROK_17105 (plasmid) [Glutamicibacter soli]|uniref:hypothetical protein n=1 Tax=Glutamicibacter soli TaxID=453836 RepID=UPI003C7371B3
MEEILTNTSVYTTLVAGLMASLMAIYGKFKNDKSKSQKDSLDAKLERLGASATEASKLAKLINVEIESMKTAAILASEKAKEAEALAGLSQEQRDAVAGLVDGVFEDRGRKDLRKQLMINFFFFLAGAVVTPFIGSLIAP